MVKKLYIKEFFVEYFAWIIYALLYLLLYHNISNVVTDLQAFFYCPDVKIYIRNMSITQLSLYDIIWFNEWLVLWIPVDIEPDANVGYISFNNINILIVGKYPTNKYKDNLS